MQCLAIDSSLVKVLKFLTMHLGEEDFYDFDDFEPASTSERKVGIYSVKEPSPKIPNAIVRQVSIPKRTAEVPVQPDYPTPEILSSARDFRQRVIDVGDIDSSHDSDDQDDQEQDLDQEAEDDEDSDDDYDLEETKQISQKHSK